MCFEAGFVGGLGRVNLCKRILRSLKAYLILAYDPREYSWGVNIRGFPRFCRVIQSAPIEASSGHGMEVFTALACNRWILRLGKEWSDFLSQNPFDDRPEIILTCHVEMYFGTVVAGVGSPGILFGGEARHGDNDIRRTGD